MIRYILLLALALLPGGGQDPAIRSLLFVIAVALVPRGDLVWPYAIDAVFVTADGRVTKIVENLRFAWNTLSDLPGPPAPADGFLVEQSPEFRSMVVGSRRAT